MMSLRVLEKLLESGSLETVKDLALDMYNFYQRQGLGLSWARNIDPEMELERIRLETREAVLVEDCLSRSGSLHKDLDLRKLLLQLSQVFSNLFFTSLICFLRP